MKYPRLFLLSVACALPFMTLIVAGLSIFLVNRNEIAFDLKDIALPLASVFLVMSGLLYFILWSVRRFTQASGILAGLVTAISLAVWVQSQLLVWNFGQFNGQGIDWDQWTMKMFLDGAVWIVILFICLPGFYKRKQKFERALVTGIYILGSVSVVISLLNAPEKIETKIDESVYKDVFTFNPDKNVLIILLDEFQSDYFEYIANKYPGDVTEFDGFTFFRNTISRFPTTKASVPSFMTGTLFKNDKPYYAYIKDAHKKFNIVNAYKDKSYNACFVGILQGTYPDIISMQKIVNRMSGMYFNTVLEFLDYAAFRSLPTFLKPTIYNNGNWFFTYIVMSRYPPEQHGTDVRFMELLEQNITVNTNARGSFKFIHFSLPHAPWRVNENLEFDPSLKGEHGYLTQARGAIRLAGRILKTLKKAGVYDHSEIVIMSDHGTGVIRPVHRTNEYLDALSLIPPKVQSASLALLLHKPADSRAKLVTNDMPLELTDLACLLGLHDDTVCKEFKNAMAGGNRQRTFYYYEWEHAYWKSEYLPPITEYIVSGDAYNPESYSFGKFIYSEKGKEAIPAPGSATYSLGRELDFSAGGHGEADPYIRAGWSNAESRHRWSDGTAAGLSFHLDKSPQKDLVLKVYGFGYQAGNNANCMVVNLVVNNAPIGRWLMKKKEWHEVVIPRHLVSSGIVNIVFIISNPKSPREYEYTEDDRKLGIGITSLVIEEAK